MICPAAVISVWSAVFATVRAGLLGTVTIAVEGGPDLNAGSILTLMGLGATQGTVVTLKADGDGADAALDSLVQFLETDHDAEG